MHDVTIPALGMAMTEAVLTQWHKQPGDPVSAGEVIAEIETDKSNVDLESPADGVLGAHLVQEGAAVPIGDPVVRVLAPGETEPVAGAEVAEPVAPQTDPTAAGYVSPPARTPHALSPRQRRLARLEAEAEAFFAVTQAREAAASAAAGAGATAPNGAVPALAPAPTVPPLPAGKHRAAIAERVAESWRTIPHFAVQREVDAGEADSVLALVRERDPGATLTDLMLRAYARAMASVAGIAGTDSAAGDVGLAVATPDGVMMPVVSGVPALDVSSLVTRRTAAVRRGREGKLSSLDLSSTPVGSLSNLGAKGVDAFTGIVPVGQQMLLTLGRVAARPVVVDGRLAVRTTVIATLNVDHRRLDGDQAAQVLESFERELGALRAWARGESA